MHEPEIRYGQATLSYTGLDDRRRSTTLRFDPAPEAFTVNQAVFSLRLEPKQARSIFVEIDCRQGDSPLRPVRAYFTSLRDARRELLRQVFPGRFDRQLQRHHSTNPRAALRRTSIC